MSSSQFSSNFSFRPIAKLGDKPAWNKNNLLNKKKEYIPFAGGPSIPIPLIGLNLIEEVVQKTSTNTFAAGNNSTGPFSQLDKPKRKKRGGSPNNLSDAEAPAGPIPDGKSGKTKLSKHYQQQQNATKPISPQAVSKSPKWFEEGFDPESQMDPRDQIYKANFKAQMTIDRAYSILQEFEFIDSGQGDDDDDDGHSSSGGSSSSSSSSGDESRTPNRKRKPKKPLIKPSASNSLLLNPSFSPEAPLAPFGLSSGSLSMIGPAAASAAIEKAVGPLGSLDAIGANEFLARSLQNNLQSGEMDPMEQLDSYLRTRADAVRRYGFLSKVLSDAAAAAAASVEGNNGAGGPADVAQLPSLPPSSSPTEGVLLMGSSSSPSHLMHGNDSDDEEKELAMFTPRTRIDDAFLENAEMEMQNLQESVAEQRQRILEASKLYRQTKESMKYFRPDTYLAMVSMVNKADLGQRQALVELQDVRNKLASTEKTANLMQKMLEKRNFELIQLRSRIAQGRLGGSGMVTMNGGDKRRNNGAGAGAGAGDDAMMDEEQSEMMLELKATERDLRESRSRVTILLERVRSLEKDNFGLRFELGRMEKSLEEADADTDEDGSDDDGNGDQNEVMEDAQMGAEMLDARKHFKIAQRRKKKIANYIQSLLKRSISDRQAKEALEAQIRQNIELSARQEQTVSVLSGICRKSVQRFLVFIKRNNAHLFSQDASLNAFESAVSSSIDDWSLSREEEQELDAVSAAASPSKNNNSSQRMNDLQNDIKSLRDKLKEAKTRSEAAEERAQDLQEQNHDLQKRYEMTALALGSLEEQERRRDAAQLELQRMTSMIQNMAPKAEVLREDVVFLENRVAELKLQERKIVGLSIDDALFQKMQTLESTLHRLMESVSVSSAEGAASFSSKPLSEWTLDELSEVIQRQEQQLQSVIAVVAGGAKPKKKKKQQKQQGVKKSGSSMTGAKQKKNQGVVVVVDNGKKQQEVAGATGSSKSDSGAKPAEESESDSESEEEEEEEEYDSAEVLKLKSRNEELEIEVAAMRTALEILKRDKVLDKERKAAERRQLVSRGRLQNIEAELTALRQEDEEELKKQGVERALLRMAKREKIRQLKLEAKKQQIAEERQRLNELMYGGRTVAAAVPGALSQPLSGAAAMAAGGAFGAAPAAAAPSSGFFSLNGPPSAAPGGNGGPAQVLQISEQGPVSHLAQAASMPLSASFISPTLPLSSGPSSTNLAKSKSKILKPQHQQQHQQQQADLAAGIAPSVSGAAPAPALGNAVLGFGDVSSPQQSLNNNHSNSNNNAGKVERSPSVLMGPKKISFDPSGLPSSDSFLASSPPPRAPLGVLTSPEYKKLAASQQQQQAATAAAAPRVSLGGGDLFAFSPPPVAAPSSGAAGPSQQGSSIITSPSNHSAVSSSNPGIISPPKPSVRGPGLAMLTNSMRDKLHLSSSENALDTVSKILGSSVSDLTLNPHPKPSGSPASSSQQQSNLANSRSPSGLIAPRKGTVNPSILLTAHSSSMLLNDAKSFAAQQQVQASNSIGISTLKNSFSPPHPQ